MSITTNDDWTWVGDSYETAFATTSDPRVVAVIERENEWGGGRIDGDAYAPAFYGDAVTAGSTFMDDESARIASAYYNARSYFVNWHYRRENRKRLDYETVTRRYMRIFHDTTFAKARSSIEQGLEVVIFNTPTFRAHVGLTEDPGESTLTGEVHDWTAALGGDVFGVGFATNESRVIDEDEIDLTDANWVTAIECGGYLGEDSAKESAAKFEDGEPELPQLLDFPPDLDEPGFREHTDLMAEASAVIATERKDD